MYLIYLSHYVTNSLVSGILCCSRIRIVPPMSLPVYRENDRELCSFDLFSILTAAFIRSRFDRGAHKVRNVNVMSRGEIEEGASKSFAKANQSRRSSSLALYDPRIYDAIFWHRCESFYIFRMHVLCYTARVPRDEGEDGGWRMGRGRRGGLARNDSGSNGHLAYGVRTRRFTLHSNCIFPSFSRKITFDIRFSFDDRIGKRSEK